MTKKNKQKNAKPKRKTTALARARSVLPPSARAPRIPKTMSVSTSITHKRICSLVDPFCKDALGGQWPDGNGSSTLTYRSHSLTPYSTFANGGTVVFTSPLLAYDTLPASSYIAPTYFCATYTGPGNAAVNPYVREYRFVTSGIIIRNILPALTATGTIIVTRMNAFPIAGQPIAEGNLVGPSVTCYPIVAGMEIPLIFRPMGMAARDFALNNGTDQTGPFNLTWEVIKVEVVGAPASTPTITIEKIHNIEMSIVFTQAGLAQFTNNNQIISQPLQTIANKITNSLGDVAYSSLKSFGMAASRMAATALGGYLGGPAGASIAGGGMQAITNYMEVD
jgi:hypothetical protein